MKPTKLARTFLSALLLALISTHCCAQKSWETNQVESNKPSRLVNGIYLVLREAPTPAEARVEGIAHAVLVYDRRKYTDANQREPLTYVAIDPASYVPIVVEGALEVRKDTKGKSLLNITLAREHVKTLEEFTRTHLGGRIAMVLGGEIITLHKVRAVIKEGKVQITRCNDNACEVIRAKLVKE